MPPTLRIPRELQTRFDTIGTYADGKQFMAFVTGAFPGRDRYPPATAHWGTLKRWNAVLHTFDAEGNHIVSEAKRGGYESEGRTVAAEKAWDHLDKMLSKLFFQNPRLCDIYIKPFAVEIDEVVYELEYVNQIEDGEQIEYMILWPNDIMFHPPWDSGEYST